MNTLKNLLKKKNTQTIKKKIVDKKTDKKIQELKRVDPKYLKIFVHSCKLYEKNSLFDSTYDIMPSKKLEKELRNKNKIKEHKNKNNLPIKYDVNNIVEEHKMISIH